MTEQERNDFKKYVTEQVTKKQRPTERTGNEPIASQNSFC